MTSLSMGKYLTGLNSKHDVAYLWLHLGLNYKGNFKLSELHDYKLLEMNLKLLSLITPINFYSDC